MIVRVLPSLLAVSFVSGCSNSDNDIYSEDIQSASAPLVAEELVGLVDHKRTASCFALSSIVLSDDEVEMNASLKHDAEFGRKVWEATAEKQSITNKDMIVMADFVSSAIEKAEGKVVGDLLISCLKDVNKASGLVKNKLEKALN